MTSNKNIKVISGHREGCSTVCPGANLFSELPSIRADVQNELMICQDASTEIGEYFDQKSFQIFSDVKKDETYNKLRNISEGTKGLQKKLDKFFEDMAEQSAGAIQEALYEVIESFNDTFKLLIGELVQKNFDKLTESINQLVIWQKDYKGDIMVLKESYERLAKNHSDFVDNTDNWISKLDLIAGSSSQLQLIINDFQAAFDDESRFSEVISNINTSVDHLKNTSITVNEHTAQLKNTTQALELTKEEITNWLRVFRSQ